MECICETLLEKRAAETVVNHGARPLKALFSGVILPAKFWILLLLTLILVSLDALASKPDTLLLEQVEVTARKYQRADNSSQKIDTLYVASSISHDLGTLLLGHSKLFLKDYGPGSLSTASFRGTAANHTLVLWNDIPLNASSMGMVDFSTIPVFLADEVGLLWGGQAAQQRAGGIGGVVVVDNKPHFNDGLHARFIQSAGSFGMLGTYGAIGYSNSRIQSNTRVFRRTSQNNFEYFNNGVIPFRRMRQADASFEDIGFMQELSLAGSRSLLKFISWNQWNNRNLPPIMTNLERGGNPKEKRDDQFNRNILSYKYHYSQNGSVELKTALFYDLQHYYLRTTSTSGNEVVTLIDSRNISRNWSNSLIVNQNINRNIGLFTKLFYDLERVNSDNYEGTKQRSRISLLSGMHFAIADRLHSSLSLRNDLVDGRQLGLSPGLEMSYAVIRNEKLILGAGFSKNKRFPGLNDLYWYPGGNPELLPEESTTVDVSMSHSATFHQFNWQHKAGLYASDINNWIQWRPTSYRFWVPANIARVYARGFEWHSAINGQVGKIACKLTLNYTYTLTTDESPVARIENSAGKQLIYIPKHHGNVMLSIFYKKAYTSWHLNHIGERNTSLNNSTGYTGILPAYNLNNFVLGNKWIVNKSSLTLELRLNNIFNIDYQAILWRPMPGRNFEGILIYSL